MPGTDINFWLFLARLAPMFLMLIFLGMTTWILSKRRDRIWAINWIVLFLATLLVIWTTFGSYGPGIAPDLPSADEEGINVRMDSVPPEDVAGAAAKAESKVPAVLKQVRETSQGGPGPEKIDEDEKFKRTLENALRIQDNKKRRKK